MVEGLRLFGRGCGPIDMSLLASVLPSDQARLWTLDQRLEQVAGELGLAYPLPCIPEKRGEEKKRLPDRGLPVCTQHNGERRLTLRGRSVTICGWQAKPAIFRSVACGQGQWLGGRLA